MKLIDKVQKIREEVERLKSQLLRGACSSQIAMETRCKEEVYNEVLAILDSIKEEPKFKIGDVIRFKGNEILEGEEKTHKIVGYDNELYVFDDGTTDLFCEQELYELVEEPVSEDLEEAVNAYIGYAPDIDEDSSVYGKRQAFKAGAQWKEKEMQSTIELAEDHAMLAGMEKMKEEMTAKAVNAELYSDGMLTPLIKVNDKEKISGIKFGDKVKIIIIKEDENE